MKLGDAFVDDFIQRVFSVCMMGSVHDTDSKRDQRLVEHLKVRVLTMWQDLTNWCPGIQCAGGNTQNIFITVFYKKKGLL